jgi:hypothetical protein
MQEIKLDDVPTVQLKAMVYDIMATIEKNQHDIKLLNQVIEERRNQKPVIPEVVKTPEEPIKEDPKDEVS